MKVRDLTEISLFATLMVVGTLVIPPVVLFSVPFTLQVLVVMLCGLFLRPVHAFLAMIIYLLLGIFGVPVFSGFSSGFGAVLGPTGGFLLSFPLMALSISFIYRINKSDLLIIVSLIIGIIISYLFGLTFYSRYFDVSFIASLKVMSVFILGDFVKGLVAYIIVKRMNKIIR